MRWLERKVDKFCLTHPRFGIPNLMLYILGGNIVVYLLDVFSNGFASALLGLSIGAIRYNLELWRLVTFVFVPDYRNPIWFVVFLSFYYFLGTTMEREWGTARFTMFYLVGSLLTAVSGVISFLFGLDILLTLGAVHDTLFLAFATLFPDQYIRVYFILPVKAKWLAAFYVFMEVWDIISLRGAFFTLILPFILPQLLASWLNYLIFFWSDVSDIVCRALGRARHQNSAQTINFKKAAKSAYQEKGYIHKCAVCGKTDTDYPDMEFRYCSKCNGYYCYCEEHINNHTHIE